MATIKLGQRQGMNQNVRPAQLQGDESIGEAYKAMGKAAANLGANFQKFAEQQGDMEDDAWVLKAQQIAVTRLSEQTINNQEKMDKGSGHMTVKNLDGTIKKTDITFVEAQQKIKSDLYRDLKKDATSGSAWAKFEKRFAPTLLSSISRDDTYVKTAQMDNYREVIKDGQDNNGTMVYTHNVEATGKSHLKNASDLIDKNDADLTGTAQQTFTDGSSYDKLYRRGGQIIADGFYKKALSTGNLAGALMAGNFLDTEHQESTLGFIKQQVGDQLDGQGLMVKEEEGGQSIVSADGKMQYDITTGHMEPYDGTAVMEKSKNDIFNHLPQSRKGEVYGSLMTKMNQLTSGLSGVVGTSISSMASKVLNFSEGEKVDTNSDEFQTWKTSTLEMNAKLVKTHPKLVENNVRKIGMIEELATITNTVAMQDPNIALRNIKNLPAELEKKYKDDPVFGRNWRQELVNKATVRYGQMRKAAVANIGNHLITNDTEYAKDYANFNAQMADPEISPQEKQLISTAFHTKTKKMHDTLKIAEDKRKTHPNSYYEQKLQGFSEIYNQMADVSLSDMTKTVKGMNSALSHITKAEKSRVLNEFGGKFQDPRIFVVLKQGDPVAQANLLMSLRQEKNTAGGIFKTLGPETQRNLKGALTTNSNTLTKRLDSILEVEGGGKGLATKEAYGGMVQTNAAYLLSTTPGMTVNEAVKKATDNIFGEFQTANYSGDFNSVNLSIPADHVSEGKWETGQIGNAVNVTQDKEWLLENADFKKSFTFMNKDLDNYLRIRDKDGATPERRELVREIMVDKMMGYGIRHPRWKEYIKKHNMTMPELRKLYWAENIPDLKTPKISSRYNRNTRTFSPVLIVEGKTLKFFPKEGDDNSFRDKGIKETQDYLGVTMDQADSAPYQGYSWNTLRPDWTYSSDDKSHTGTVGK